MKRYKDPFEAAIEEEHDESSLDSPVSDGSDDDVGLLRQVKKLKISEDMEVDLTKTPANDREKEVAKMHAIKHESIWMF